MDTAKLLATHISFVLSGSGMALLMLSLMYATDLLTPTLRKRAGRFAADVMRTIVASLIAAVFVLAFLFWILVDRHSLLLPALFLLSFVGTALLLRKFYLKLTPQVLAALKSRPKGRVDA